MTELPPAVRILPMDARGEFQGRTSKDVQQDFFLVELPSRQNGCYRYHKAGLKAPIGTVVLFQYGGYLIASAVLTGAEKFQKAEAGGYEGAMYFDIESIKVFDPIGPSLVSRTWPEFKGFGRAKWSLSPERYPAFLRRLSDVETPKR